MKPANPIEEQARAYFARSDSQIKTTAKLDEKILADALKAQERFGARPRAQSVFGNPFLRLAAVPTVVLVVLLAVVVVPHLTTPAWAIDQTIQALRAVKGIHLAGWCVYPGQPKRDFEIWARPSLNDPAVSGDFRLREDDVHVAIASEQDNLTSVLELRPRDEGGSVVYLTEGLNRRTPLQTDRWFEHLKKEAKNWTEELHDDPRTGRRIAVVTCEGPSLNTARFWEFQFDVETKLPIRARVWFQPDRQGDPHWDIARFAYDPVLTEDTFKIKVPDRVQVVDCRVLRNVIEKAENLGTTTDIGLVIGDAKPPVACRMVAEAYWKAVIQQNWDRVRQLRPLADGSALDELKALYQEYQPVALTKVLFTQHLEDPGTFAEVNCLLQLKDGRSVRTVLNVDFARFPHGTVAVVAGSLQPEFTE